MKICLDGSSFKSCLEEDNVFLIYFVGRDRLKELNFFSLFLLQILQSNIY